jgi:YHS domain-containing protein
MGDVNSLVNRIDAEFATLEDRIKRAQAAQLQDYQGRQERLAMFEKRLEQLSSVWRPRLEALLARFGDKVHVTPTLNASSRTANLEFQSELARVNLRLTASTDRDVRNLVLEYRLEILPILMQFNSQDRAEWPLDAIDEQAIANWVDDRLVDFVKTYLTLHENQYYLKDHLVEDPIAEIKLPKFAAAAQLDWEGKRYYFISEETKREFQERQGAVPA